jgi:hypothetical protein
LSSEERQYDHGKLEIAQATYISFLKKSTRRPEPASAVFLRTLAKRRLLSEEDVRLAQKVV